VQGCPAPGLLACTVSLEVLWRERYLQRCLQLDGEGQESCENVERRESMRCMSGLAPALWEPGMEAGREQPRLMLLSEVLLARVVTC